MRIRLEQRSVVVVVVVVVFLLLVDSINRISAAMRIAPADRDSRASGNSFF